MRSRRLLIILVIFIVLAGIAIIGGTVFRVKKIEIVFTNTASALNQSEVSSLLQGRLEKDFKGKNILFSLDKAKITKIVEDTNIFLKVTNVKAEFPNRIVVDVRERFPVYLYQGVDEFVLDAEMRVLYKNDFTGSKNDLTDMSPVVGNDLFGLNKGDYITGEVITGDANKEKIDLIAFIPKFFAGTSGYEATMVHQIRGIKFNPTTEGGVTTMRVEVQPELHDVQDVRLMIMKAPGEDFTKLFEMVWATMSQKLLYENNTETKQAGQAGIYVIYYNENGKLEVVWYSAPPGTDTDDNGFPNNGIKPTAKFTEDAQA